MITRNKIIFLVLLFYSFGFSRDLKILHMEGTFDIDEDANMNLPQLNSIELMVTVFL